MCKKKYPIGEIIKTEKYGNFEVMGYDMNLNNRIIHFKNYNITKTVQVNAISKGIISPKVSIKWDEETVKEKMCGLGYELLEPFKGKIINQHHVRCLKCGFSHYMNGDKYMKSLNSILHDSGCGFCSGRYANNENNLQVQYSDIVNRWDYAKNKIKPFEVTSASHLKVWVICPICGKSKLTDVRSIGANKSCACQRCTIKHGKESPKYNPNLTDEEREENRDTLDHINWRTQVYKRDNYTCRYCGNQGHRLNAHHLAGYNWCKEKRLEVSNGVTLCKKCHIKFHSEYGGKNNTIEQFETFAN